MLLFRHTEVAAGQRAPAPGGIGRASGHDAGQIKIRSPWRRIVGTLGWLRSCIRVASVKYARCAHDSARRRIVGIAKHSSPTRCIAHLVATRTSHAGS